MCFRRKVKDYMAAVDKDGGGILSDKDLDLSQLIKFREQYLTDFFNSVVNHNDKRLQKKLHHQNLITFILIGIIVAFALTIITVVFLSAFGVLKDVNAIATLLSIAASSFIASVFSLLHVVVKYIFPSEEEKNNHEIIKTIIESDLSYLKLIQEKDGVNGLEMKSTDESQEGKST